MAINELARLCTRVNYIRSNYFSDTYRAEVDINGVKSLRDIVHISIPFDKNKETIFKSKYSFTDEQMLAYYKTFADNLKTSWKLEDSIDEKEADNDEYVSILRKIHLFREDIKISIKETKKGSDIFLQYPITDSLEQSMGISDTGAQKKSILSLGIRLLQIFNAEYKEGIWSYYYGPDTLVAVKDGLKSAIKSISFMYSGDGVYNSTPTADMKRRTKETAFKASEIRARYEAIKQQLSSDDETIDSAQRSVLKKQLHAYNEQINLFGGKVYPAAPESAIAILLLLMLNGKHYTTQCDAALSKPKYCSYELYEVLKETTQSERPSADKLIVAVKKELDSCEDIYIPFELPMGVCLSYEPERHIGDELIAAEEEELDAIDDEEEEFLRAELEDKEEVSEERLRSKRKLMAVIISIGVLVAAAAIMFVSLPMLGINIFAKKTADSVHYSADSNLYNLGGVVVDIEGNTAELYSIDEYGNIVYGGKIRYESEYVSEYPVIKEVEVEILSQEFATYPSLDDYEYREGLFVIDSSTAFEYDPMLKTISLPEDFARENELYNGSFILIVRDGKEILLKLVSDGSFDDEIRGNLIYCVNERSYTLSEIRKADKATLDKAKKYDELSLEYWDRYLKGRWTYILTITPLPESAVNKDIELIKPNDGAYEIKINGKPIYEDTESIHITSEELKSALITISSTKEGPCEIAVKSAVGSFEQQLPVSFPFADRDIEPVIDTSAFIQPTPVPTPTAAILPTPTATQTPVYYQSATQNYPAHTTQPTAEAYAESAVFSANINSVALTAGQTTEITTTGDDGGYIQIYSTDTSVALIDVKNGIAGAYTITALSPGECTIMLVSSRGTVAIKVTVN